MEEKIYKIILGDGTEISNLKLNGNNFISTEKIEESVFADNCSPVTISDGTTETVHPNMELVQIVEQVPGEYWFVLRDISEEEFARTKMQSDIAYVIEILDPKDEIMALMLAIAIDAANCANK